jgi:hypothetical protein
LYRRMSLAIISVLAEPTILSVSLALALMFQRRDTLWRPE